MKNRNVWVVFAPNQSWFRVFRDELVCGLKKFGYERTIVKDTSVDVPGLDLFVTRCFDRFELGWGYNPPAYPVCLSNVPIRRRDEVLSMIWRFGSWSRDTWGVEPGDWKLELKRLVGRTKAQQESEVLDKLQEEYERVLFEDM